MIKKKKIYIYIFYPARQATRTGKRALLSKFNNGHTTQVGTVTLSRSNLFLMFLRAARLTTFHQYCHRNEGGVARHWLCGHQRAKAMFPA
jgi:hypothetical protein